MRIDPERVHLSTGNRGTGKSTRLSLILHAMMAADPTMRAVVLDVARQWPYGALRGRVRWALCSTAAAVPELLRRVRLVVVRLPGKLPNEPAPTRELAGQLISVAVDWPGECALVLPEAQLAAPNGHRLPDGTLDALTLSRAHRFVLLADTQHPARLTTVIRDECTWYAHATKSPRDVDAILDAVRDTVDPASVPAAAAAVRSLTGMPPGFHIRIDGSDSDLRPHR